MMMRTTTSNRNDDYGADVDDDDGDDNHSPNTTCQEKTNSWQVLSSKCVGFTKFQKKEQVHFQKKPEH